MGHRLVVGLLVCWLSFGAGCDSPSTGGPREPGPHASERGKVTLWQVTDPGTTTFGQCTDDPGWIDQIALEEIEAGSFVAYRIGADGGSAVLQTCTTTAGSSCNDGEDVVSFVVEGSTLSHVRTSQGDIEVPDLPSTTCKLERKYSWTLMDLGNTGVLRIEAAMALVDNDTECGVIDEAVRNSSANGYGVTGCVVARNVGLDFHAVD